MIGRQNCEPGRRLLHLVEGDHLARAIRKREEKTGGVLAPFPLLVVVGALFCSAIWPLFDLNLSRPGEVVVVVEGGEGAWRAGQLNDRLNVAQRRVWARNRQIIAHPGAGRGTHSGGSMVRAWWRRRRASRELVCALEPIKRVAKLGDPIRWLSGNASGHKWSRSLWRRAIAAPGVITGAHLAAGPRSLLSVRPAAYAGHLHTHTMDTYTAFVRPARRCVFVQQVATGCWRQPNGPGDKSARRAKSSHRRPASLAAGRRKARQKAAVASVEIR